MRSCDLRFQFVLPEHKVFLYSLATSIQVTQYLNNPAHTPAPAPTYSPFHVSYRPFLGPSYKEADDYVFKILFTFNKVEKGYTTLRRHLGME